MPFFLSSGKAPITRRTFLRGAGVALALPWLDSMQPVFASGRPAAPPRRMVAIETNMGILPQFFFPDLAGREHGGRRGGVVGARGGGDPPVLRRAEDRAVGQGGAEVLRVVLDVPAVPEEDVRDPGGAERLLGGLVLGGQAEPRAVGV